VGTVVERETFKKTLPKRKIPRSAVAGTYARKKPENPLPPGEMP